MNTLTGNWFDAILDTLGASVRTTVVGTESDVPVIPRLGATLKSAPVSLTSSGTVVPSSPLKQIAVYAYQLVCRGGVSVAWRSGAITLLEGPRNAGSPGVLQEAVTPPSFLFETAVGQSLDLLVVSSGSANGRVSYYER